MKHRTFTRVVALLAMLFFVAPVVTPVSANSLPPEFNRSILEPLVKETNQTCSNLDVVFIVDQSWAMSAPGTQEASDPLGQREYAVEAMVDLLTQLALDDCPGTHHRIAVISYGDSTRVDLNLYDINPKTADQVKALRDENGIKKQIVATNMRGNNPQAAFSKAEEIWRTAEDVDSVEGKRKQVIIFFTSGISNTKEDYAQGASALKNSVAGLFPFDSNLLNLENCLSDLRKQSEKGEIAPEDANKCMVSNPVDDNVYKDSTYIWTVFLKPPGYRKYGDAFVNIIKHYEEMSRAHGGEAFELDPNSRKEIPTKFREILSSLAGIKPVPLSCGYFAVNPYLNLVHLTVYHIDKDQKITLSYIDQDGTTQKIVEGKTTSPEAFTVKDYYSYGTNESYIFSYPYAGLWKLDADNCSGLDIYYDPVDIDASRELNIPDLIPQYEVEPFYDLKHPEYLEYELQDQSGSLIPQAAHPRFVVDINATVTDPAGETKDYKMIWNAENEAFHSTEPLLVKSAGIYNVRMIGTTYVHKGNPDFGQNALSYESAFNEPITLFDIPDEFEVAPVTPFTIDIESPLADTQIKNVHALSFDRWVPLDIAPLTVKVHLLDRDGNMLTKPEEYLASTEGVFTAHIEGGGQTSAEIKLQPDPNNPGYFFGEIPAFDVVGEQKIMVVMDQDAMLKDRRPYDTEVKSEFKRIDDLVHTAGFWQFMLIFVALLITEETIRYFAIRNNKVSGMLVIQDGSATIAEFNLSNGKNKRVITQRELRLYPQILLKSITVKNSAGRRSAKINHEPGSVSYAEGPSICVACVNLNGKSGLNEDLPADASINYDETSLTMMYKPL